MDGTYSIYIDGNGYGFGNIGDDAILQGIVRIVKELPGISGITIAARDGIRLPFLDPDTGIVPAYDLENAKRMIDRSDCLVVGGGTMVSDELGFLFPLIYNTERILYAAKLQKDVILFGIGANNLLTQPGKDLAGIMIRHSGLITVRDRESAEVCRSLSRDPGRISRTADPAFMVKATPTGRSEKVKELIRSKGMTIGVNVVNEAWAGQTGYKKAIAAACDALSKKEGIIPVFISNETRPGPFFDHEANRKTASYLGCDHVILEPVYYTPGEMIDIISTFDIFLSMRMHGLIFASIANVPFTTVSRIDKVDNFMNLCDRNTPGTVETVTSRSILEDCRMLLDDRKKIALRLQELVAGSRDECRKNSVLFHRYATGSGRHFSLMNRIDGHLDPVKFRRIIKDLKKAGCDVKPGS